MARRGPGGIRRARSCKEQSLKSIGAMSCLNSFIFYHYTLGHCIICLFAIHPIRPFVIRIVYCPGRFTVFYVMQ